MTHVPLPRGFRAAGTYAGIKKPGRGFDLGVLIADEAYPAAAVFTQNALLGAHVHLCREHLAKNGGLVRAIVVNSGCANCATGQQGIDNARRTAEAVATRLGCPPEQVLPISTGAIGAHLPMDKILAALPDLIDEALQDPGGSEGVMDFTRAIMTTDTFPKLESATFEARGGEGRVTGIAKGAGMIHPNMATMLGFLTTDAELPASAVEVLRQTVDRTFHRVTVDGDTSPNDTVVLWASGLRAAVDEELVDGALLDTASRLCKQIAADGEGATRLVTVQVRGAASEADASHVGRTIATSPLTKTAVAGRDPNWGRILSAAGRAGVPIDVAKARVWIGSTTLYEDGRPFPDREPEASRHLAEEREVTLGVDLGVGEEGADVWTCDLTADYVRINADYRT
ncbi:MAG: bifunctional glutamate N-acetyltransferase/amino-acid acetyltransferase ArgJ [Planctomycetota bacterium]|nr:bifunctional glutamate N-acetyltransferase/amino-acid acetyltransferase ArgJ [Planctomycetota bacterium]MDA0933411.1 bifunctional glutamate N-acetyltransferase/amino-acid acetyltransferase ArgJ [Planctomycetota bacterium]MDA1221282.1 bifunctional glutamate N-acetyltransferase/amino-acid acetyltransferase ArgJ [Planctomycetota bacterium]